MMGKHFFFFIASLLCIANSSSALKLITSSVEWNPFPADSPIGRKSSWPNSLQTHGSTTKWLNKRFQLWKGDQNASTPGTLASFTSIFYLEVWGLDYQKENISDPEGLTFLVSSNKFDSISNSDGQWLGLTNSTLDGDPSNQFIAVEIDSKKESSDPDAHHLGLDINSINSTDTFDLSELGIALRYPGDASTNFWVAVRYKAATTSLLCWVGIGTAGVTLDQDLEALAPVINRTIDLKEILGQDCQFGFTSSTGESRTNIWVTSWTLRVQHFSMMTSERRRLVITIVFSVVGGMLVLGVLLWLYWRFRLSGLFKEYNDKKRGDAADLRKEQGIPD